MRKKNTFLLPLFLIFIYSIDIMAARISSKSDKIIFPDEFEKIKAQEEIFTPGNIQIFENVKEESDCDLERDISLQSIPIIPKIENRNIIGAPSRCPEGYRADPTGKCRKILPA